MKKCYVLAITASLAILSYAAVPFEKGKAPLLNNPTSNSALIVPARVAESQILVDEDFSKFSDGSETEPGTEITYDNIYYIPDSYTAQSGWTGQGVRPAGGCVSLYPWTDSYGDDRGGYISTPKMMLDGTATLTFRAKALTPEGAALWVALCDDDYGPGNDQLDAELSDQWEEFSLIAASGSLEMPSYFQFAAEEGIVLVDDVKIEFRRDRVATPYALAAINVSPTEFVAQWEAVDGADGYLLNVICTTMPETIVSGEIVESFDGINVKEDGKTIDTSAPNYPEGWHIDVSTNGSQDVSMSSDNFNSGSLSLIFDAVGDTIVSPVSPEPIDGISLWCKPTAYSDNYEYMSLIRVEIYHSLTDVWENVAHLCYYNFMADGGFYSFPSQVFSNDVTRVRFSYLQKGEVDFFIDDIKIHYTSRGVTAPMITDLVVNDTKYAVKDINPRNEYTYYVKAFRDDVVSSASYSVWVDGLVGLRPQLSEPAEITPTSFVASWEQLGHATDYTVNLFRLVQPSSNLENVTVLEETFDNITEGTVDNPGMDWVSPFDFGAKGWASTSWSATQPAWASGMAGTRGTNYWMGTAGLVYTPVLDLSCYDGNGITVDATFVTTVADFAYGETTEPEGVFAIIMNSNDLAMPIASGLLDTPVVGSTSGRIIINNVPEGADLSSVVIAFMNKSGLTFFVDYAKISMNVPAGKTLMTPVASVSTTDTSYKFENLDSLYDHAFSVTASVNYNYESFVSDPSDTKIVRTSLSSVSEIANSNEAQIATAAGTILVTAADGVVSEIFTPSGLLVVRGEGCCSMRVPSGIYIVRVGSLTVKVAVN